MSDKNDRRTPSVPDTEADRLRDEPLTSGKVPTPEVIVREDPPEEPIPAGPEDEPARAPSDLTVEGPDQQRNVNLPR